MDPNVPVHGQPTLVNNIETLASVPHILANGAAWFQDLGLGGAAGPGDINHLESLCDVLLGSGLCGLVDGAATVVRSSLDKQYRDALNR